MFGNPSLVRYSPGHNYPLKTRECEIVRAGRAQTRNARLSEFGPSSHRPERFYKTTFSLSWAKLGQSRIASLCASRAHKLASERVVLAGTVTAEGNTLRVIVLFFM